MFDHSYSPDIARGLVDRAGRPCPTGQYACKCGLVGASHDRPVCSHYTPADLAGSPCNTCDNDYSVHRPEWVRRANARVLPAKDYTRSAY